LRVRDLLLDVDLVDVGFRAADDVDLLDPLLLPLDLRAADDPLLFFSAIMVASSASTAYRSAARRPYCNLRA
jgi:hypothetical protein